MWFACGQIFQTRSAIARFGSFVVTMVCAIGGGPDFQLNSIEDCPDVHVRGSWFSRFSFWNGPVRHVDVAHPLLALQWIEVNPIEKVIQMVSQNWRRSLV